MIRQDYGPATVCFSHCQFMSAGLVKHSFQSQCVVFGKSSQNDGKGQVCLKVRFCFGETMTCAPK